MTSKQLSPTANLLRHSRLFSLPPPIPKPNRKEINSFYSSDTATLPYPTHAAIETPTSSLCRGDWGLKRALPLKSTTSTSNPVIRVSQVDSIDHITDFESAADHALTLQKLQEMNLPISVPRNLSRSPFNKSQDNVARSVFEKHLHAVQKPDENDGNTTRWKFKGPWLAGLEEGQFEDYVARRIKPSRKAFRAHLWKKMEDRKAAALRQEAMDHGKPYRAENVRLTKEEFEAAIVRLRQKGTDLWTIVWEFLDFPGKLPPVEQASLSNTVKHLHEQMLDQSPPSTHPSAGLSYLRTKSHVHNHPILGPVNSDPPIEGRVFRRNGPSKGTSDHKLIGVGGLVTDGFKLSDGIFYNVRTKSDASQRGGEKVWVRPKDASIDPDGKIRLSLKKVEESSIAIWENRVVGQSDDNEQRADSERIKALTSRRMTKSSQDVLREEPLFRT